MIYVDPLLCAGCGCCDKDCILALGDSFLADREDCIECGHCVAVCPTGAISFSGTDMEKPIPDDGAWRVTPHDLLQAYRYRRSIRNFQRGPLSDEELALILEAGRLAPTGSNAQDVAYIVVREQLERFRELAIMALARKGAADLASAAPKKPSPRYARIWQRSAELYRKENRDLLLFDAGTVIILTAGSSVNAAIAAAKMETMIYSMGLGMLYSGFLCLAVKEEPELSALLGLPEHYTPAQCLIVGKPAVKYFRNAPRRPLRVTYL